MDGKKAVSFLWQAPESVSKKSAFLPEKTLSELITILFSIGYIDFIQNFA